MSWKKLWRSNELNLTEVKIAEADTMYPWYLGHQYPRPILVGATKKFTKEEALNLYPKSDRRFILLVNEFGIYGFCYQDTNGFQWIEIED